MNCSYCEKEMQKGEVQIGDIFESIFKSSGPVVWIAEDECKKILPKNTVHLKVKAEGYYCEQCGKVVATFEERGAEFLQ